MTGSNQDSAILERPRRWMRLWRWLWRGVVLAVLVAGVAYGSFYLVYQGKIYPGVSVDGVYVSSLSQAAAAAQVQAKVGDYPGKVILVRVGDQTVRVLTKDLQLKYDVERAVAAGYNYGRQGSWQRQLSEQLRALSGRPTTLAAYTYDDAALADYVSEAVDAAVTPAADAELSYDGGELLVRPGAAGRRLDIGQLTAALEARLAAADDGDITAPLYDQPPLVATAELRAAAAQAKTYLSGSLTLGLGSVSQQEVKPETILTWIKTTRTAGGSAAAPAAESLISPKSFPATHDLADLYPAAAVTNLGLDRAAVAAFVANLAKTIDRDPANAGIAWQDGHIVVTKPSTTGTKLDQKQATDAIIAALAKTDPSARTAQLNITVTKPAVREDNLDSLGIKDQLSEGETYFPGSGVDRLTNVRLGAAKMNGVLVAPGATFSFGENLGAVGPEQGYTKGLIILGNKEVPDYGGGLCQVVTTTYRAALLAGLDIIERTNHAFAISYYTWPYGAPGVDATLYYPPVDLKFKNDTPAYLLIQTHLEGVHLKFDFYGTKVKYGVVESPTFLEGSNDAAKPSKTIFYRDIFDLDGKQIAHDPVVTSYKSSLDFTIQD